MEGVPDHRHASALVPPPGTVLREAGRTAANPLPQPAPAIGLPSRSTFREKMLTAGPLPSGVGSPHSRRQPSRAEVVGTGFAGRPSRRTAGGRELDLGALREGWSPALRESLELPPWSACTLLPPLVVPPPMSRPAMPWLSDCHAKASISRCNGQATSQISHRTALPDHADRPRQRCPLVGAESTAPRSITTMSTRFCGSSRVHELLTPWRPRTQDLDAPAPSQASLRIADLLLLATPCAVSPQRRAGLAVGRRCSPQSGQGSESVQAALTWSKK